MSTSYIGSDALSSPVTPLTVPGFDVLNPASNASNSSSSSSAGSSSSTPVSSTSKLNQYQQSLLTLDNWQAQILGQSLYGDLSGATDALYSSAGLSADSFANLAAELQSIQASPASGSAVDASA